MKWRGRRKSSRVEDRRGGSGSMAGKLGIGGIIIVALVYFLGGDPSAILQQFQENPTEVNTVPSASEDELKDFVSVVLAETEDVWSQLFQQTYGREYREPYLVLFSGRVESACGLASAATGPFYCPADQKVYIDLSFYEQLKNRFKAPGDFAMAYVIAHEVGHHVQRQLGITEKVHQQRGSLTDEEYNKLSVRLELQADYLAGVWAYYAQNKDIVEEGDIEEALNAANAIGDDRLQKQSQGYVVPESFTHGTSAQRIKWFKKGFLSGDMEGADTFNIPYSQL